MKFIATIFLVYLASKVLRPTIEALQQRIKEGMAAGKMAPTPSEIFKGIIALFAFVVAWQLLDTTVLMFFMFWVGWQLFKPVMEGLSKRMEDMARSQQEKPTTFAQGRPHRGESPQEQALPGRPTTFAQGRPHRHEAPPEPKSWELGQAQPGGEETDLERLFGEAMERKRRMGTTEAARPQSREYPVPARPRAAQPRAAQPRTRPQRVPPRAEPARTARPRKPVSSRPARRPSKPRRAAPRRRESVEARRRAAGERPARPALACLGEMDKNDIRRGIIMAEILGPPKALRDINPHVI